MPARLAVVGRLRRWLAPTLHKRQSGLVRVPTLLEKRRRGDARDLALQSARARVSRVLLEVERGPFVRHLLQIDLIGCVGLRERDPADDVLHRPVLAHTRPNAAVLPCEGLEDAQQPAPWDVVDLLAAIVLALTADEHLGGAHDLEARIRDSQTLDSIGGERCDPSGRLRVAVELNLGTFRQLLGDAHSELVFLEHTHERARGKLGQVTFDLW